MPVEIELIDPRKIPSGEIFVDTSVFLLFMGDRPKEDKDTKIAQEIFRYLIDNKRTICLSPFTVIEYIRGIWKNPNSDQLRKKRSKELIELLDTEGFKVLVFDTESGKIVGEQFPERVLRVFERQPDNSKASIKYDVMIVSCAVRHNVSCILALDQDIFAISAKINFPAYYPRDFLAPPKPQLQLPMITQTVTKTHAVDVEKL